MALRLRAVTGAETTSTKATSAAFAAAKARWERAGDERRALKARLDGAQAALALAGSPPGKGDHPSPRLIALANGYLEGCPSASVEALRAEIVDLDDRLRRASTTYSLERVAWQAAVEGEARRLAEELKPAHTVIDAALTRPADLGLPFASWTLDRLVAHLAGQGIAMRRSRISEIFLREGLRWRREETWFGERVDPDFARKRGRSSSSTRRRRRAA